MCDSPARVVKTPGARGPRVGRSQRTSRSSMRRGDSQMALVRSLLDDLGDLLDRVRELLVAREEVRAEPEAYVRPEVTGSTSLAQLAVDRLERRCSSPAALVSPRLHPGREGCRPRTPPRRAARSGAPSGAPSSRGSARPRPPRSCRSPRSPRERGTFGRAGEEARGAVGVPRSASKANGAPCAASR